MNTITNIFAHSFSFIWKQEYNLKKWLMAFRKHLELLLYWSKINYYDWLTSVLIGSLYAYKRELPLRLRWPQNLNKTSSLFRINSFNGKQRNEEQRFFYVFFHYQCHVHWTWKLSNPFGTYGTSESRTRLIRTCSLLCMFFVGIWKVLVPKGLKYISLWINQ